MNITAVFHLAITRSFLPTYRSELSASVVPEIGLLCQRDYALAYRLVISP